MQYIHLIVIEVRTCQNRKLSKIGKILGLLGCRYKQALPYCFFGRIHSYAPSSWRALRIGKAKHDYMIITFTPTPSTRTQV
jgi:hypothetical protein